VKKDVEPKWNRLVAFWSTQDVPHEVLSSYKDRLAVSVWFICGRESLRNTDAFQRLFAPSKLRCIAGRDRRSCLKRAGETDEERRLLSELPLTTVFSESQRTSLGMTFRWRSEEEVERSHESLQDRAIRQAIQESLKGHRPEDVFKNLKPQVETVAGLKLPSYFEAVDDEPTFTVQAMQRQPAEFVIVD